MLNADLRQIFAEKLLLNGRMPQSSGCGTEELEFVFSTTAWIWWKVLLQAQLGGIGEFVPGEMESVGGSEEDLRSQCFFVKTGTSANAQ
jgi:hypothetical protein